MYGVALKVAANINRQAARRRAREYAAAHEPRPAGPDATWPEISEALDEELNRLPEQLKAPLVACYLEGKTRDEAARELGWGLDLLRGRLQRGRALLRSRLARRGLGLGAVLLATFLGAKGAAALSPAVQARIVEAASLAAAGRGAGGVVSARVLTLAEGALQAMHTKTKIVAALLLTLSIAVAATGWGFTQAGAPVQVGTRAAAATTAPAAAQAPAAQVDGGPVKELPDLVALAEKDVAIKKAALKAALAQKAIAEAKIKLLRSKGAGAEALVRVAKARLERFRDLQKQKAVEDRIVDEAEANYQSTVSARQEAEAAIQLGEAEIALEAARTEVAEAELDKATLQHKLLRDRLPRK